MTAQQQSATTDFFGGANHTEYLDWLAEQSIAARYPSAVFLPASSGDPSQGVALHWKVDETEGILHLAIATRRANNNDNDDTWLAFGISQAGGMLGADVVYWEASRPDRLTDAHVIEARLPIEDDDCHQDWTLVNVETNSDAFLMWEGSRPLDTGDGQDFAIAINDASEIIPPHRVIAAWGSGNSIGYHGRDNVARGAVHFFRDTPEDKSVASAVSNISIGNFFVGANNHTVRAVETDYVTFCFTKADLLQQNVPDNPNGLHVVAFEPVVTEEAVKYVHHFVVTAAVDASNTSCADNFDYFMETTYGEYINLQ